MKCKDVLRLFKIIFREIAIKRKSGINSLLTTATEKSVIMKKSYVRRLSHMLFVTFKFLSVKILQRTI